MTTDLVVEWVNRGFSKNFIFFRTRVFFFSPSGPEIISNEQWDDFAREFDRSEQKYTVVLRTTCSPSFRSLLPNEFAKISPSLQPRTSSPRENRFTEIGSEEVFVTLSEIEALDARSAAISARRFIENAGAIALYHSHREQLKIHPTTLVYEGNRPIVLKQSTSAVHKERDCASSRFAREIQRMDGAFFTRRRGGAESQRRLTAALGLHASAVNTDDPTVQLTSLWAAVEALLPVITDQTKVSVIADYLGPALCRYYPLRLLRQLPWDLERACGDLYQEVCAQLPGDLPDGLRGPTLVALPEHEALRDRLYASLESNPLLRFRLFTLKRSSESASELLTLIRNHRQRVEWHIRRIYRSRNLLVHAGRKLPYLVGLVENLHAYVHVLLASLVDICGSLPVNIDSALLALRLETEAHEKYLAENKGKPATKATLVELLCGPVIAAESKRLSATAAPDPRKPSGIPVLARDSAPA